MRRRMRFTSTAATALLSLALTGSALVVPGPWPAVAAPGRAPARTPGRAVARTRGRAAADPAVIAVAGSSRSGSYSSIRLISARTGRLVRVLAPVGTGNGFALAPQAREAFVVGLVGGAIEIRRITIPAGTISDVARGAYPAVSPGGGSLAYATGSRFTELAVRDLRTGSTRVVDLARLLGTRATLLNQGAVTWLSSDQVLAVPGSEAVGLSRRAGWAGGSGSPSAPRAAGGRLRAAAGGLSAVVVTVTARGLTARKLALPRSLLPGAGGVFSGDGDKPGSFLAAQAGSAGPGPVDLVTPHGSGVTVRVVATLPRGALPVAFAPHGDRVLYLLGGRPPALWVGTISGGRLTGQRRLLTDDSEFGLDAAAW